MTVATITFPTSVQPPAPAAPTIQLAASVQPTAQPAGYFSQLIDWWQPIFWPSFNQPVPTRPSEPIPTPGSIPSSLEGAYHAIEPWVRYGFEVATYAVGWVPYVGWLSGQIMIFYNFGERIVHAIAHNTLDWLNGNGSFVQNVADGVAWTVDAFIQLGIDEWNFFLPPLPPLPPFPFSAQVSGALNNVRDGLRDPVLGVLQQLSDRLPSHDPEPPPPAPVVTTAVERGFTTAGTNLTAQVSSVPKAVANALKRAAGAEDTTEAIVPDVPRAPRNTRQGVTSLIATPGSVVKGAVQSKRQVKAAATETTGDDSTVGPRRRVGDAGGNIATTVKKRVTDTASTVKKVSDDTRKSMKKAKSDSG